MTKNMKKPKPPMIMCSDGKKRPALLGGTVSIPFNYGGIGTIRFIKNNLLYLKLDVGMNLYPFHANEVEYS